MLDSLAYTNSCRNCFFTCWSIITVSLKATIMLTAKGNIGSGKLKTIRGMLMPTLKGLSNMDESLKNSQFSKNSVLLVSETLLKSDFLFQVDTSMSLVMTGSDKLCILPPDDTAEHPCRENHQQTECENAYSLLEGWKQMTVTYTRQHINL